MAANKGMTATAWKGGKQNSTKNTPLKRKDTRIKSFFGKKVSVSK